MLRGKKRAEEKRFCLFCFLILENAPLNSQMEQDLQNERQGRKGFEILFLSIDNPDNVANLGLDSHKRYCTLCWNFFMQSRKIFVGTVICLNYRCNFLIFGRKKLPKTARIT